MVTTWILILTLFTGDYRGGVSVSTVAPFATRAECMRAGDLWLKQNSEKFYKYPTALCVYTTAPQPTVTY